MQPEEPDGSEPQVQQLLRQRVRVQERRPFLRQVWQQPFWGLRPSWEPQPWALQRQQAWRQRQVLQRPSWEPQPSLRQALQLLWQLA